MNTNFFLLSLLIAVICPAVAVAYLRSGVAEALRRICDEEGGAEFWARSVYLLAVSGTLVLMLTFGEFGKDIELIVSVRRALLVVLIGIFVTVAVISQNVSSQIEEAVRVKRNLQTAKAMSEPRKVSS